ncbi:MAG TPA: polyprenyl synthetase family protein [Longimicrobiales bacterium]|nr:polyprenyl synthetase family protein [Longimicrobiales bacterium]
MPRTAVPRLARIQHPVHDPLEGVEAEIRRIILSDFPPIQEVSDYLALARGKLFRPTLLLLANRVGESGGHERAPTLAGIVELVHLATLVHDDAVDHSVLRRGMPTVNALWNHQSAIIMGDYLYSRAVTELATFGRTDLIAVLAGAANEMSVGEMRQLVSADALGFTEADYERLIRAKTASLMAAACEMGAMIGDERYRGALASYGHFLGMAFQITDDLLDYTATEQATGKPTGHDLREHKMTLPLIAAMARMAAGELAEVEAFFADPVPSDEGIRRLIQLSRERGGIEYARARAEAFGARAAEALQDVPGSDARDALSSAVGYVVERRR